MVATLVGTSLSGELEGGIIAANADKFNRQLHPAEMDWIEEHAKTFAESEGISEQVAKFRLTQQALKELDLGMRLTLDHSLDSSASEFLKSASNLSFSSDLGQSQALFSLQGNQYVRPALFATEVDIQFYKENVHRGVEYQPGEGLNVFLDDFQARGEQALSGLPLHVKEKIKDISVKVQEDPSYASRYMREVQLSGFVSAVKAYSALNRCVSSVECLSGMANSVKDGAVRQSHALGESGAVVMDDTSKELLNEVYGQDVEGMSKTLLAAQSALVLAEVIPAVKIAQIRKADGGRVEDNGEGVESIPSTQTAQSTNTPKNNTVSEDTKNNAVDQSDAGALNGSLLPPPRTAAEWRNSPGQAFSSGGLSYVKDGDKWLRGTQSNAGKVPKQIADKLNGQQFKNFGEFRQKFWNEVAKDPVLSKNFTPQNRQRMLNGRAPFASTTQQVGGRKVYELDHNQEIQNGGSVYDANNIIIRTPLNHIKGK